MIEELLPGVSESILNLLIFIAFIVTGISLTTRNKKVVDFLVAKQQSIGGKILTTILLGFLIIATLQFVLVVADARMSIGDSIAIFAAILAGPAVGIVVGLIGGIYRIFLGGWSAIPSGLAITSAGIIGAYLWYKGYRIRTISMNQITAAIIIVGIWEVVHTEIYIPLLGTKPFMEALVIMTSSFVIPMATVNMIGIGMFLLLCRDAIEARKREERLEEEIIRWQKVAKALEKYKEVKQKKK